MIEQTAETRIVPVAPAPPNAVEHGGTVFVPNSEGHLVPLASIKPTDLLMDEVVRKILSYGEPLSAQIARFKQHSFDDVDAFVDLLAQHFGAKLGGRKGNTTLMTIDGLIKVQVAVADNIVFGPELQTAKLLFDECVMEWSAGGNVNIQALIQQAFKTDKEGHVNRADLVSLMRVEIDDPRWKRAVDAIRESQRVIGSKRYIRIFTRRDSDAGWEMISLNVAGA